ncbi:MAG: alpha/beta fold hydrolase [Gammaproteobacteria bacterium]|jgi:pimeloyl-ACP methyl ester carboxylesterase|nr:alpha/beta fold hydrolase [Gammaproteobacteria bacterium]
MYQAQETDTERPVLVCLHGSASSSGMWRDFKDLVRDRATVIAPDLTGQGRRALADDVQTVLRQTGAISRPFHIVAHARGAAVAACVATLYPKRVASIVCFEPTGISQFQAQRLRMPVRLLSGTRSWLAARQAAEKTAAHVTDGGLLKMVGLRHMAPLTHPHLVNPVFLDFVLPVAMPDQFKAA